MKNYKLIILILLIINSFQTKAQSANKGNIAISVDKLNVIYVGVDNPVTISLPSGHSIRKIEIENGEIIGYGFKRIIRTNSLGQTNVVINSVDSNGSDHYNYYTFRAKKIPDPFLKVGSGKSKMLLEEFNLQDYCRLEMLNFDFDIKFKIIEASVSFSEAGFPEKKVMKITGSSLKNIKSLMNQAVVGTVVSFNNVKIEGPDGIRSIDGVSFSLY